MEEYANVKTRIAFILQLGYFKAKQQFYSFDFAEVTDDVEFINKTYFEEKITATGKITREYLKRQRDAILALFGYSTFLSANQLKNIPRATTHCAN
jgi:hypothetical protein